MSWKEDIVKLNSPHSKLLYMIYYFSQLDSLSSEQATKLKEYVVLEDEKIFNILNEFDASADDLRLLEDMKQLYMQEVRFLQEKGQKMTAETRAGPLSETTSINAISGVGYKKQLSVNTERSFLNNAMSSINKRMTVKGDPEQEVSHGLFRLVHLWRTLCSTKRRRNKTARMHPS